jgi:hypothetical protein
MVRQWSDEVKMKNPGSQGTGALGLMSQRFVGTGVDLTFSSPVGFGHGGGLDSLVPELPVNRIVPFAESSGIIVLILGPEKFNRVGSSCVTGLFAVLSFSSGGILLSEFAFFDISSGVSTGLPISRNL